MRDFEGASQELLKGSDGIVMSGRRPLIKGYFGVALVASAVNAAGLRINPFSCASPLSHPRFLCRLGPS